MSTSYRLRRSSRRQQSAPSSESSWYIPDDVTARNRGSISLGSFKRDHRNGSGLLDDEIDNNEQIDSDAHSSSMSSSESPNGAHLSLDHKNISDSQLLNPKSHVHAHVGNLEDGSYTCSGGGQGAPVQRTGNGVVEVAVAGNIMANEEEMINADPVDCEDNSMDTDTPLPQSSKTSAGTCTCTVLIMYTYPMYS